MFDASRPALIVFSMGTTFKGGVDDQQAINKIVEEMNPPAEYHHVDAALFGGDLAHVVVMQNVSKKLIDEFINELSSSK